MKFVEGTALVRELTLVAVTEARIEEGLFK